MYANVFNRRCLCAALLFFFLSDCTFHIDACSKKRFYVESYGKDNAAIAKLVADVNKNRGGHIVFPKGETYVLSITDDFNGGHRLLPQESAVPFTFKNCKYLDIDLNGSTISLKKNHSSKYALFLFNNCKSFSLKNGIIRGDAQSHDYSPVVFNGKTEKSSHEWGHGIMVIGSRGGITDVKISYMSGDGIYIASSKAFGTVNASKVDIDGCDISFCRRNGISCASNIGFNLSNTSIHEIGSYGGLQGTNPKSGIDFEYEDQLWCKGEVIIKGCFFSNCERKTITSSNVFIPSVKSLLIEDCVFNGSIVQISNLVADDGKTVKNCRFDSAPINCGKTLFLGCHFTMGPKLYYVHGSHFSQCDFVGTIDNLSGPYGCAIVGDSLEAASFENCSFQNIRGLNNSSPAYQGISGYNFPLVANFKDCNFLNTSFVKGNPKIASSFHFDNCILSDGCMIYNEGGPAVVFVGSKVDNVGSYHTQTGEFIFDNCEIIQDNESIANPLLYFGTHRVSNSRVRNTLSVTPKMKAKGVQGIKYKD